MTLHWIFIYREYTKYQVRNTYLIRIISTFAWKSSSDQNAEAEPLTTDRPNIIITFAVGVWELFPFISSTFSLFLRSLHHHYKNI